MKMLSLDDAIKAVTMLLDFETDTDKVWSCDVINNLQNAPSVTDVEPTQKWISVNDKLPPNADHPGAFCPRYQVMTKYGVTEGWYNPDKGCWYTLVWFYLGRKTFDDIDFERGDIPGITDKIEVTHWKAMPEPPKEDAASGNH